MIRAAVFGAAFDAAAEALGLETSTDPEIVLVDLADDAATAAAALVPPVIPRVALGAPEHERMLRAAGCAVALAPSAEPAVIGPLLAAARPTPRRRSTRVVTVSGPQGGSGRTLLVAGLALRLAARVAVLVIDATGSGMAGWWLRVTPAPWSELEGLVDELTTEHLGIVAAERERLRVIGGAPVMPSAGLLAAAIRESVGLADLVLVDAPSAFDERTGQLLTVSDRLLLVSTDETGALAALERVIDDDRTWLVASRSRAERLADHHVFRSLPDDPAAIRVAARGTGKVGGALGHAYDDLADLLALDIT